MYGLLGIEFLHLVGKRISYPVNSKRKMRHKMFSHEAVYPHFALYTNVHTLINDCPFLWTGCGQSVA